MGNGPCKEGTKFYVQTNGMTTTAVNTTNSTITIRSSKFVGGKFSEDLRVDEVMQKCSVAGPAHLDVLDPRAQVSYKFEAESNGTKETITFYYKRGEKYLWWDIPGMTVEAGSSGAEGPRPRPPWTPEIGRQQQVALAPSQREQFPRSSAEELQSQVLSLSQEKEKLEALCRASEEEKRRMSEVKEYFVSQAGGAHKQMQQMQQMQKEEAQQHEEQTRQLKAELQDAKSSQTQFEEHVHQHEETIHRQKKQAEQDKAEAKELLDKLVHQHEETMHRQQKQAEQDKAKVQELLDSSTRHAQTAESEIQQHHQNTKAKMQELTRRAQTAECEIQQNRQNATYHKDTLLKAWLMMREHPSFDLKKFSSNCLLEHPWESSFFLLKELTNLDVNYLLQKNGLYKSWFVPKSWCSLLIYGLMAGQMLYLAHLLTDDNPKETPVLLDGVVASSADSTFLLGIFPADTQVQFSMVPCALSYHWVIPPLVAAAWVAAAAVCAEHDPANGRWWEAIHIRGIAVTAGIVGLVVAMFELSSMFLTWGHATIVMGVLASLVAASCTEGNSCTVVLATIAALTIASGISAATSLLAFANSEECPHLVGTAWQSARDDWFLKAAGLAVAKGGLFWCLADQFENDIETILSALTYYAHLDMDNVALCARAKNVPWEMVVTLRSDHQMMVWNDFASQGWDWFENNVFGPQSPWAACQWRLKEMWAAMYLQSETTFAKPQIPVRKRWLARFASALLHIVMYCSLLYVMMPWVSLAQVTLVSTVLRLFDGKVAGLVLKLDKFCFPLWFHPPDLAKLTWDEKRTFAECRLLNTATIEDISAPTFPIHHLPQTIVDLRNRIIAQSLFDTVLGNIVVRGVTTADRINRSMIVADGRRTALLREAEARRAA